MKLHKILSFLEDIAPPSLQEKYDNASLICGNSEQIITKAIICLDSTEDIVDEAIAKGANLIIAHHPIVFSGLKTLTGKNYVERVIIKAIKNDIAIYAIHTNLDNVLQGVNSKICNLLDIKNPKILVPKKNTLLKLVYYTPTNEVEKVKKALFEIGAGKIGNYSETCFEIKGKGSFKAGDNANPFIGTINKLETVEEIRTEMIIPSHLKGKIISKLAQIHPYEEVAYDLFNIENKNTTIGAGMIGELDNEIPIEKLLEKIKSTFNVKCIKHTKLIKKNVKRIALCGGSGSFLLKPAINQKADIYLSADFKYHEFFDAENKIIIVDIGHYESEQFTKDLLYDKLMKKFPTFAFLLTEIDTNPVEYYT